MFEGGNLELLKDSLKGLLPFGPAADKRHSVLVRVIMIIMIEWLELTQKPRRNQLQTHML